MTEAARYRPALWVATALCVVAAIVAIPIVGGDDDGGGRVEQRPAGDSDPAAPASEGAVGSDPSGTAGSADSAAGAADRPGAKARSPETTAAPRTPAPVGGAAATTSSTAAPEELGAPKDPGPAVPPRAGSYRYKVSTDGQTRDATTVVEDRGTGGGETRQLVKIRGEGFDIDNDVVWRAGGVHVLQSVVVLGQSRGSCDWDPDTTELRLPIARGVTWESASTCAATGIAPAPIPLSRKISGTVIELRRVRVAGRTVDVWAIDSTQRIEAAGRVWERKGVTLFSPKHGLPVSFSGRIRESSPDGAREYDHSTELQNLEPE